ncbi:MAG: penicillin-binding protein [Chloroflexota bacterium]|nr:penicillin-binding protein [Chloroflexota bacterium]
MSNITQLLRARKRRHRKYNNVALRRTSLGIAMLLSIFAVLLFIGGTIFYAVVTRDLPSVETIHLLLAPPDGMLLQPTRFYDRSGEHILVELENPAIEQREYVPIKSETNQAKATLPTKLVEATIAIADPTFWHHPGFTTNNLLDPEEHNTLAQQLVSNLLLWNEAPSQRRAIRERLLAAQITSNYGREKVLEWYLNSAYYGNLTYGVDTAAQVYLGKSAADLSLAEAALLAGVAQAPSINPHNAPDEAITRGHEIIAILLDQGNITTAEAQKARKEIIEFREAVSPQETIAPTFINLVWEQLSPHIPIKRLERGGFEIITTLDYDLQIQAACTTKIHLARLEENATSTLPQSCEAARLLPTLTFGTSDRPNNLAANVIILTPHTGEILTFINESPSEVVSAHPTGTTISPFIYLTAFTRGLNPASLLWDIPTIFSEEINQIANPNGEFHGPMRLRQALANDYPIPALATMRQIGAENVWRTLEQFGISAPSSQTKNMITAECPECQTANLFTLLNGGDTTLLKMAQAFGALANQGFFVGKITNEQDILQIRPITIQQINDVKGQIWLDNNTRDTQAVTSTQLAYLMTHILSDEAARWGSLGHPNPLEIGRPAAAKLGRTKQGDDVWTIGYTPQLVVGVWVGRGASDSFEAGELTPKVASTLWHAVMQYSTRDLPAEVWDAPPGITTMAVCDPSGLLPTKSCPSVVNEIFLNGHEPTQPDTLYHTYQVNRETGRLATVFTPPELIDESVYLLVPPEASQWAQDAGLSTPPESYDVIYSPKPSPDAQITAPEMFTNQKGELSIRGSASGDDFRSYRLQVGKGLNPQNWLAIGEDITTPVESGQLETWDTAGLNGLYAIQLIVVRSEQRVDTNTIQVTIDNQCPQVVILYPENGQTLAYQTNPSITFQVQVNDNLGLDRVEYYLDAEKIATQTQSPFALFWRVQRGEHTLKVKAIDMAGNKNKMLVTFVIE